MVIGKRQFDVKNNIYMMGILNVTPDSFSDGGKYQEIDKALYHVEQLIEEGTDIIDIGGESTRPNHIRITSEEEINRVCPIIEAVRQQFDIPISLDTYKSDVAKAGIAVGVDLINDIWGLKWDRAMAEVIAQTGVACCIMHNRHNMEYQDIMQDMISDLQDSIDIALKAGIEKDQIILDPGIGFAKDKNMNLMVLNHLEDMGSLGYPILLGTSRKSVIGLTLDLPTTQREEGTIATTVMGIMKGCTFFRVHNVKSNLRAARMAQAIMQEGR